MFAKKLTALLLNAMSATTHGAREESYLLTAINAQTIGGYSRARTDTGDFKREYYAISNGGAMGNSLQEHAMAVVPFSSLVKPLGEHLARHNYHLAKDKASADLLLVVHWGVTLEADRIPDPEMRDWAAEYNARLLGYTAAIKRQKEFRSLSYGVSSYQELDQEVAKPRFYVVVSAYDFRSTVLEGKRRLLWITRISIRSAGNSFAHEFSGMLAKAAPYFGQNTEKLLRQEEINARVDIGELKVVGETPADKSK